MNIKLLLPELNSTQINLLKIQIMLAIGDNTEGDDGVSIGYNLAKKQIRESMERLFND